jgi:hypothetical protein
MDDIAASSGDQKHQGRIYTNSAGRVLSASPSFFSQKSQSRLHRRSSPFRRNADFQILRCVRLRGLEGGGCQDSFGRGAPEIVLTKVTLWRLCHRRQTCSEIPSPPKFIFKHRWTSIFNDARNCLKFHLPGDLRDKFLLRCQVPRREPRKAPLLVMTAHFSFRSHRPKKYFCPIYVIDGRFREILPPAPKNIFRSAACLLVRPSPP